MAVTLDQVREMVRGFLRDFPEENRLISGEESANHQIDLGILLALDDFNFATAPVTGANSLSSFPSLSLLVLGSSIWVLRSAGISQSRNFLTFTSGGISAVLSDKTAAYQSWINMLERQYESKKAEIKMFQNLQGAWGGVSTAYSGISYYSGAYSGSVAGLLDGFRGFA